MTRSSTAATPERSIARVDAVRAEEPTPRIAVIMGTEIEYVPVVQQMDRMISANKVKEAVLLTALHGAKKRKSKK
jgi:hypothetical protein